MSGLVSLDWLSSQDQKAILFTSITLCLTYYISRSIYRLYFHPLSRFPGPWQGALTQLYRDFFTFQGIEQRHVLKLHRKYGPVVRIGPNYLIFIQPEAWKDIYGHRNSGKSSNKREYFPVQNPGHEGLISIPSDEKHGQRRRVFAHAFSEKSLREQEPMFRKYVDLLLASLRRQVAQQPNKEINMVDYLNFTTFDIMSDLTFSEPLGLLEKSEYSPWVSSVFKSVKLQTIFFVIYHYPPLTSILQFLLSPRLIRARNQHKKFSQERVDRRLERGSDQPDIWTLIMRQEGIKTLSRIEMYSNADLFMTAGTETTATLLSGMTFYLLKTPHAMKRLQAELDDAFAGGEGLNGERLAQLKYLQACLEEALRIYPPVAAAMNRVSPPEGCMVAGHYVPGDTIMGVTHYAASLSEDNFALPKEYHPERWLPEGEEGGGDPRFAGDNKLANQPFSVGPRNCLGRNMALFEMRIIAAELFRNFDLELRPQSDDWENQKIYTLWEKNPLMVRLKPRNVKA